jgi:Holliday junction resolvase RusA-like endonuclease
MKGAALWLSQNDSGFPNDAPLLGPLFVRITNIVQKAKTSKLVWPRGDVDNYAKAPLDAITKAATVWHDDDQVVDLHTSKRFANPGEQPGTLVEVYR